MSKILQTTFTQFLGYTVCRGENNIMGEKKVSKQQNFCGKFFFEEILLFFENIFGDHFYISKFVPAPAPVPALGKIQRVLYKLIF